MAEETTSRPGPPRKESKTKKIAAYLKLAADVASIVMDLRDRPRGADWFSLALRATNTGIGWYTDRRKTGKTRDTWDYFNGDSETGWKSFPHEYSKIIVAGAQNLVVAEEFLDTDVKMPYVCLGKIGRETVGWVTESGQMTDGPFYKEDRAAETLAAVGDMVWRILGGRQLLYTPGGLVLDCYTDRGTIPTEQMETLLARVRKFLAAHEPRSYLLCGVPGTGKSIAIRWLASMLNMSSVRIDLRLLSDKVEVRGGSVAASLETMLRILRPDVMILDDLDRVEVNAQLLAFLEVARESCKIVLASANYLAPLSGAASRPGRFDDILTFDLLDRNVVENILGHDADLAELVLNLPAAYVAEFAKRCRVLGREQALEDLEELERRAKETSEDGG